MTEPITAVPVPSKARLLASVRDIERMIGELPEPLCAALERSGVVAHWRAVVESLSRSSEALVAGLHVAHQVSDAANTVRKVLSFLRK